MVKFFKSCSKSFHHDTDCIVAFKFSKIWPTGNQWNRALFTGQKKFRRPVKLLLLCGSRPKSARASPQLCTQECSRFDPNWFTFGGVI